KTEHKKKIKEAYNQGTTPSPKYKNITPPLRNKKMMLTSSSTLLKKEKGPIVFMKKRNGADAINAQRYIEVLKENLVSFRHELIAKFEDDIIYQDDNAPIHMA
ncbi:3891_t:CDS:2, partial [Cetraspora pellucida]